jgi:hypothetical protein
MVTHIEGDDPSAGRSYHPVLYPQQVPITMKALDRLGWPMQHRVTIAGVRVLVRSTVAAGWDDILDHVPAGRPFAADRVPDLVYSLMPPGGPCGIEAANHYVVIRGSTHLESSTNANVVLKRLLSDLTAEVAQRAPRWSLVHAGAVAWDDAGIVLPGPSGSGKSTLVAALLRLGATYYSDEVGLLDGNGRLHPFLKPLWLRLNDPEAARDKTLVRAASLGASNGRRTCPVRLIVFPEWRAGSRLRLRAVPRSLAVLGLFSNSMTAQRNPERALRHATKSIENARAFHLRYPDAERAAQIVLSQLQLGTTGCTDSLERKRPD